MVRVKPFAAIRPPKDIVTEVAAPPYDVLNSEEAKEMAGEKSLLHITKPEIDFNPILEDHDPKVYDEAVKNFKEWQKKGWLRRDPKECYYVYAQTMEGRTQYGLVLCAHTDDYASGKIKKHELTRKDKEDDRMVHVRIQNANIEPVFFAYKDNHVLNEIVAQTVKKAPEYDFIEGCSRTMLTLSMLLTVTTVQQQPLVSEPRRGLRTRTTPETRSTTSSWRCASRRAS